MKTAERISYNEKENWGGLEDAHMHTAAVGARIADNRSREFGVFPDRITVVGDKKVAAMLQKWALGKRTLQAVKKHTRFSFYGQGHDENTWMSGGTKNGVIISLIVRCCGEYVYLKAYADKVDGPIDLLPSKDENGESCWEIVMNGNVVGPDWPKIHADSKDSAMSLLLDYIGNELEGKGDLWQA
jgi:hypothetical protein